MRYAWTSNEGASVDTYRATRSPAWALTRSAKPSIVPGGLPRIRHAVVPGRLFSATTQLACTPTGVETVAGACPVSRPPAVVVDGLERWPAWGAPGVAVPPLSPTSAPSVAAST